jgi:hypothetical protein
MCVNYVSIKHIGSIDKPILTAIISFDPNIKICMPVDPLFKRHRIYVINRPLYGSVVRTLIRRGLSKDYRELPPPQRDAFGTFDIEVVGSARNARKWHLFVARRDAQRLFKELVDVLGNDEDAERLVSDINDVQYRISD